jgi:putative two-component system response regulator
MNIIKTILVVDDEPGIANGLAAALQNWGYKTFAALDGKKALDSVKDHMPDLVLLDVSMPKMDGFEVLKRLKENVQTSHISVIMLTAKTELPDKLKAAGLHAQDYLTKPVELEKVKQAVEKVFQTEAS